jgi:hypothetical protein
MSPKYKAIALETFSKVLGVAKELNLTHFLYSGSLLGSWRHHGVIPWDDDIDILFNISDRIRLEKGLANVGGPYRVKGGWGERLKFWSTKTDVQTSAPWKWPFIDISFFKNDLRKLWGVAGGPVYKMEHVFPIHKRPFEQFWVNAPHNSPASIMTEYPDVQPNLCQTWWYNHKKEQGKATSRKVPCENLKDYFPFVHRRIVNGAMEETLKVNDKVIHTYVVLDEPLDHLTSPYDYTPASIHKSMLRIKLSSKSVG